MRKSSSGSLDSEKGFINFNLKFIDYNTCVASVNIMEVSKSTFKLLHILEMWDGKCKLKSKIYCKYVYVLFEVSL